MDSIPDPAAPGSISSKLEIFQGKKMKMLFKLINGATEKNVHSGLKMLIEDISYLLVES